VVAVLDFSLSAISLVIAVREVIPDPMWKEISDHVCVERCRRIQCDPVPKYQGTT
jgi:hypothetical protein